MHCGLAQPKLLRYLDGELSPEETAEVAGHLTSCPACSDELAVLRREAQSFREALKVCVPPGLELSALRRIRLSARGLTAGNAWELVAGPRFWRALVVSAVSVALALAGLALISPPAYAMVVGNVVRFGAQFNAIASKRFPAWGEVMRIIVSLRMLIAI